MIKTECKITLFDDKRPDNGRGILYLGDSIPKIPWRPFYRLPWDEVSSKFLTGCNMIFTLNPDVRVDFDCKDKKVCNPKLLDLLHSQKKKDLLKKIILVYEYGEKGKEHGKLHYHGICKVQDRQAWEKEIVQVFNRRSQCTHRTLQTKLIRTPEDRDRYVKYMKKESQNKIKCLIAL